MDIGDHNPTRVVGEYEFGPRIGSGSFAVVWRANHRSLGLEVAVKEVDKKLLSPKVKDNLLKEISILSTIDHPNIIRFFEAIETKDRIYLVLEYCGGGDLSAYIHQHGKVSESVARHFMRQLAAGLQVLQENHLIHRDLKPQNLLLSGSEASPLLKIGDFGFARSLTPQDLAATLCGSPLYMAPEIIQNQKYGAKADLWSVGAILFQLVTGKPPFDGSNHIQLFQNILRSNELQFPGTALQELHPDCLDLCRSLLRRNPVERLTFKEFFNHKFLQEPRQTADVERVPLSSRLDVIVEQSGSSTSGMKPSLHSENSPSSSNRNLKSAISSLTDKPTEEHDGSTSVKSVNVFKQSTACEKAKKPDDVQHSSSQPVIDSMEFIEREYVLVNPHSASMESSSYYLDTLLPEKNEHGVAISADTKKPPPCSAVMENPLLPSSASQATSSEACVLREVQRLSMIHPLMRLKILLQYVEVLADLAQERYDAGQVKESFSVQLVILAVLTKGLQICDQWVTSSEEGFSPGTNSEKQLVVNQEGLSVALYSEDSASLSSPSSAKSWVTQMFVDAYNRAEGLSKHLKDTEAAAQMPDAMEIIYQRALAFGKSGGVDEYMNNKTSASRLYSKAVLLLAFIVDEAMTIPMNPPFFLTPDDKRRIQGYITNLRSRQSHL